MFGFRSLEFFWKNPSFLNSQKFCKNSSEIRLEIISCFLGQKKTFFEFEKPCFGVKKSSESSEKFRKVQKQGFPNNWNLLKIQSLFYSKLSKNYEKMIFKSNFRNREKLILI